MSNEPTDSSKDPSEKSDAMSEKSNSSDTSDPSDPLDPQLQLIINLTGLCMVLCSSEGMVVNNACINPDLLQGWLELLPDYDWSEISIRNLLSPTDVQDLDPEDFDPGEEVEFKAFCILGEIFHALLQPFVNVELSLSEQIESLIKFANLLCGVYIRNGTAFMPNQPAYELQQCSLPQADWYFSGCGKGLSTEFENFSMCVFKAFWGELGAPL
ncbi:hypothetical protein B0H13DRAFT_2305205 [Mycena leptocephala]|nr:hypothetical protein B0H13DRAFT_2305205 [Mycena leptocephala]